MPKSTATKSTLNPVVILSDKKRQMLWNDEAANYGQES